MISLVEHKIGLKSPDYEISDISKRYTYRYCYS